MSKWSFSNIEGNEVGSMVGSTAKGAGAGAAIGTLILPGVGTAIGAGIGAGVGAIIGTGKAGVGDKTFTKQTIKGYDPYQAYDTTARNQTYGSRVVGSETITEKGNTKGWDIAGGVVDAAGMLALTALTLGAGAGVSAAEAAGSSAGSIAKGLTTGANVAQKTTTATKGLTTLQKINTGVKAVEKIANNFGNKTIDTFKDAQEFTQRSLMYLNDTKNEIKDNLQQRKLNRQNRVDPSGNINNYDYYYKLLSTANEKGTGIPGIGTQLESPIGVPLGFQNMLNY
jgi:hypothetical protein